MPEIKSQHLTWVGPKYNFKHSRHRMSHFSILPYYLFISKHLLLPIAKASRKYKEKSWIAL